MNNKRRKELYKLSSKLNAIKDEIENGVALAEAVNSLPDILSDLEDLKWEEEYYMDNIPENLQGSSRYEMAEEACDNMDCAIDNLNDAIGEEDEDAVIDSVNKAIDYIDDATA